jgi:2-polyprenyl-3-methyl-5-hydroxy-6-metoxy-1,4-benzoquinol methylase
MFLLSHLNPGMTVLDLGAGEGRQAEEMAKMGAKVIAVDRREPSAKHPNIEWAIQPIEEWVKTLDPSLMFDAIHARNIIQFFPYEWTLGTLIPLLQSHLKPGGFMSIETFYKNPVPPFERPFSSLYSLDDLSPLFADWNTIHSSMEEIDTHDLQGFPRHFFGTSLLVQSNKKKIA